MAMMYGVAVIDFFIVLMEWLQGDFNNSLIFLLIIVPLFLGLLLQSGLNKLGKEIDHRNHDLNPHH